MQYKSKPFTLVLALFFCLVPLKSWSAQWAKVKTPTAIIYSDKEMSSPIGFVKKGRKIRVGNKARNVGRVLPIIVSGRVGYIKVEDIQFDEYGNASQSASERIKESIDRPHFERRISALAHLGVATFKLQDLEMSSIGIKGYYVDFDKRVSYRLGLDRTLILNTSSQFDFISIPIDYSWILFNHGRFEISIYSGNSPCTYRRL